MKADVYWRVHRVLSSATPPLPHCPMRDRIICFCNHSFDYSKTIGLPGKCLLTILTLKWFERFGNGNRKWKFVFTCSRPPHNCETKHFKSRQRRVSAIIFQLFKVIMLEKCVLTILELNWNQGLLGHKKTKIELHLSSKYYALVVHTNANQVILRRRKNENVFKMSKDEKCTCKACQNTIFSLSNMQICGLFVAVVVVVA